MGVIRIPRTGGGQAARTPGRVASPARLNIRNLITAPTNNGTNNNGAPIFPGSNTGATIDTIRKLIKEQPRTQGFSFVASAGVATQINNVALPGDARVFLGIMFDRVNLGDSFSLSINNNLIIKNSSAWNWSQVAGSSVTLGYFPCPQPLSGTDIIEITYLSNTGTAAIIDIHFI